ncbi:MAG: hypothetical protein U5L45_19345 [Saprospiraceae bacterium]|nr:hypothetical protein [Saprospiraceae bacterium]
MKNFNPNTLVIISLVIAILLVIYDIMNEKKPITTMRIFTLVGSIVGIISTRYYKQGQ